MRGKLSPGDCTKSISMITVDVHNRDIVKKMIDEKAENASVFTWQSQLRYRLDDHGECVIQIAEYVVCWEVWWMKITITRFQVW